MNTSDDDSTNEDEQKSYNSRSSKGNMPRRRLVDKDESLDRSSFRLRQRLNDKQKEINSLEEELAEKQRHFRLKEKKMKKDKAKLEDELNEVTEELELEKQKSKSLVKQLQRRVTELTEELDQKNYDIERKDKVIANSKRYEGEHYQQLEEKQQSIKVDLENDMQRFKEDITKLRSENKRLLEEVTELKTEKTELEDKNEKLTSKKKLAVEKLRKKIDEQDERKSFLEKEIEVLKVANQNSLNSLKYEKTQNEELQSLMKNMQLSLEDHKKKIQALERSQVDSTSKNSSISSSIGNFPISETIVAQTKSLPLHQSPLVNEETAECPNCNRNFGASLIEKHLEACLDQF